MSLHQERRRRRFVYLAWHRLPICNLTGKDGVKLFIIDDRGGTETRGREAKYTWQVYRNVQICTRSPGKAAYGRGRAPPRSPRSVWVTGRLGLQPQSEGRPW